MSDLPGGYQPEKGGDGDVIFPNIGPSILTPAPCCGLLTLYRELVVECADWRESAEQSDDDLAYIARIAAEALGQRCHDARPREAVEQLCAAYEGATRD